MTSRLINLLNIQYPIKQAIPKINNCSVQKMLSKLPALNSFNMQGAVQLPSLKLHLFNGVYNMGRI